MWCTKTRPHQPVKLSTLGLAGRFRVTIQWLIFRSAHRRLHYYQVRTLEDPKMESLPKTLNSALNQLVSSPLSSVEFVQDYMQLHFDGSTITAYIHPYIVRNERKLSWGDSGYRDSLCDLIRLTLEYAEISPSKELTLTFEDHTSIKITSSEIGYRGPEAFTF